MVTPVSFQLCKQEDTNATLEIYSIRYFTSLVGIGRYVVGCYGAEAQISIKSSKICLF